MTATQIFTIAQLGMLGLGLCAGLYLFVSLKRDISRIKNMMCQCAPPAEREPRASEEPGIEVVVPGPSLNFHKRAQAMRLVHRGEPASHIAAAARIPLAEAELLVKLHGRRA